MKYDKKLNVLDLFLNKKKKTNNNKEEDHLFLKKLSLNTKPRSNAQSPISRNPKFNTPNKDYNYNVHNINSNNSKEQLNQLNIIKYKKLLLPSLSVMNSKTNNNIKDKKAKLIKIKKINYFSLADYKEKNKNQKLKGLYKENYVKKKNLEKYKVYQNQNFNNFSFQKYNEKLILLSSMDLSEDNLKIFKKNMKCIEKAMNGHSSKNKYNSFLGGIERIKANEERKKILSLSENTTPRNNNINFDL